MRGVRQYDGDGRRGTVYSWPCTLTLLRTTWSLNKKIVISAIQVVFAIGTDIATAMLWSLPRLFRGQKSMFLVMWDRRAPNLIPHMVAASVLLAMFWAPRIYKASHGMV